MQILLATLIFSGMICAQDVYKINLAKYPELRLLLPDDLEDVIKTIKVRPNSPASVLIDYQKHPEASSPDGGTQISIFPRSMLIPIYVRHLSKPAFATIVNSWAERHILRDRDLIYAVLEYYKTPPKGDE